jgi:hypothetical protein
MFKNAGVTCCCEGRGNTPREHIAKLARHVGGAFVGNARHASAQQQGLPTLAMKAAGNWKIAESLNWVAWRFSYHCG